MGDEDVLIVSSKACQAFAKRHVELDKLIKQAKGGAGLKVKVDVHKKISSGPDVGAFAVLVKGGKVVLDLGPMPRPFNKLKALDIPELANKVAAEL